MKRHLNSGRLLTPCRPGPPARPPVVRPVQLPPCQASCSDPGTIRPLVPRHLLAWPTAGGRAIFSFLFFSFVLII